MWLSKNTTGKTSGRRVFSKGIAVCCCLVFLCLFGLYRCHVHHTASTGLPSDEEMIANFQAHRADFEELVRQYRTFTSATLFANWDGRADIKEKMRRVGIGRISETTYRWYPDPYSIKTAQEDDKRIHNKDFTMYVSAKYWEIVVKPEPENKYRSARLIHANKDVRLSAVWKDFVHIPEVPRIENGSLVGRPYVVPSKNFPDTKYYEKENVYIQQKHRRVLPSLNTIPENWKVYECVYRQLEPQWFLEMCNGR